MAWILLDYPRHWKSELSYWKHVMHGLKVHYFINNTPQLDILHAALIYDCLGAFFPSCYSFKEDRVLSSIILFFYF